MTSLTEKLKALGVKVGASDLPKRAAPPASPSSALDAALGGAEIDTRMGRTYVVDLHYPTGAAHGHAHLKLQSPLTQLGRWAGHSTLDALDPTEFAFLDTETTGLSGGSGTYAFLVGIGRFENDQFHLAQFFLRDPAEEPALLGAIDEFLAPCRALVTFNGKAFDAPLLLTRYATHHWRPLLADLMHVDLLHLARRLWRNRLADRSLGSLEAHILETQRTEADVPGWMVPSLYFDFLRSGDPEFLRGVFYHNAMDVLSLAALMDHMAAMLSDPLGAGGRYGVDLIALAKLYEDLGETPLAADLYLQGLEHEDARSSRLPRAVLLQAIDRLAQIHKRRAEWEQAVRLWQQAARFYHISAYVELAKCYEHHLHDLPAALEWTQAAISAVNSASSSASADNNLGLYERRLWLEQLQHRLERLERLHRKAAGGSDQPPDEKP